MEKKTKTSGCNIKKAWALPCKHYKSLFHENPMKMCWKTHEPFFMAMNSNFRFHGANLSHEISMKFFTGYFHEPWKVYKAMNMDFHESWNSKYILDWYILWHLKGSYSLACISWLMKGLMAHEIPMKAQLKTHKMCPTHTSTRR